MSKSLTNFFDSSPFIRGIDMDFFEEHNADLIKKMKNWEFSSADAKKMYGFLDNGDKSSVCATLATAKYAPETDTIKDTMIERLSHLVEDHFDPAKADVIARDTFVDTVVQYLPLKEKPFKQLHDTIRSWQVSDSSIKYAADQSGPEL